MTARRLAAQEEVAVALLRKGHTAASVARHESISVHPSTVRRWAAKHGIELSYPYNPHEGRDDLVDVGEIIRLRRRTHEGRPLFTLQEIADMCGCSRSYAKQVCARARREGKL